MAPTRRPSTPRDSPPRTPRKWPAIPRSPRLFGRRNRKTKGRALPGARLHPDPATHTLHHALTDRQPHARAGILIAMEPFEHAENPIVIFRRDADTVVPNGEDAFGAAALRRHVNARTLLRAVFNAVADQVLKDLRQKH